MDLSGAMVGWVLYVMAAGSGGAVTINADLWFHDEADCRAAVKAVTEQQDFKVFATCIAVPEG